MTVKLIRSMTELLYPRRCPLCDGILERKEISVCRDCRKEVLLISGAVCCTCGKPLERETDEYCVDCRKRRHVFQRCRAAFVYRGKIRDSLMRFKYLGRAEYAGFYARAMAEAGNRCQLFRDIQLLVPVPIHRRRRRERGYNQAELLAEQLSLLTGIPTSGEVAVRKKNTRALKSVTGGRRSRNLSDAFTVPVKNRQMAAGKRILLIDDIYTTGSTADAVSRSLLDAGALSVSVLCLAVSPGFS